MIKHYIINFERYQQRTPTKNEQFILFYTLSKIYTILEVQVGVC